MKNLHSTTSPSGWWHLGSLVSGGKFFIARIYHHPAVVSLTSQDNNRSFFRRSTHVCINLYHMECLINRGREANILPGISREVIIICTKLLHHNQHRASEKPLLNVTGNAIKFIWWSPQHWKPCCVVHRNVAASSTQDPPSIDADSLKKNTGHRKLKNWAKATTMDISKDIAMDITMDITKDIAMDVAIDINNGHNNRHRNRQQQWMHLIS